MDLNLHLHTVIVVFVVASFSLGLTVRLAADADNRDGLITWSYAIICNAIGYALVYDSEYASGLVQVVLFNLFVSIAYSLFIYSIGRFFEWRPNFLLILCPPVLMVVLIVVLFNYPMVRGLARQGVLLFQICVSLHGLLSRGNKHVIKGMYALVFGLSCVVVLSLLRVVVLANGVITGEAMPVLMKYQPIALVFSFVALVAMANGFVLMVKERSDARIRALALKDGLTHCWNRVRVEEVAGQEMERLRRYGHPVAMIMIDLDHFKAVNDRFGHAVGDQILKGFAHVARRSTRSTDVVGRWGGEEFIVILPSSGFLEAVRVAERIRSALERYTFDGGYHITASFGVAVCQSLESWEDWLNRADAALYRAKSKGRNTVETEGLEITPDVLRGDTPVFQLLWRKQYESGNSAIDGQHRHLFLRANDLMAAIGEKVDRQIIVTKMNALVDEVSRHFRDEERLLNDLGSSGAEEHASLHDRLLERAWMIARQFDNNRLGTAELVHFIIYELIAQHILIADRGHVLRRSDDDELAAGSGP